jgi:hypothetical protein
MTNTSLPPPTIIGGRAVISIALHALESAALDQAALLTRMVRQLE